jgi:hypothetical protein
MSMSMPINGVSRDDVRVKVDGIALQQQEIEGRKIGWLVESNPVQFSSVRQLANRN